MYSIIYIYILYYIYIFIIYIYVLYIRILYYIYIYCIINIYIYMCVLYIYIYVYYLTLFVIGPPSLHAFGTPLCQALLWEVLWFPPTHGLGDDWPQLPWPGQTRSRDRDRSWDPWIC